MKHLYFDHNATTPIHPQVVDAMAECYLAGYANPESPHHWGRLARRVLDNARQAIADLLGADLNDDVPDRVIFTSGGTEANNLAILGLAGCPPGNIVISSIEHPSVVGAAEQLQTRGFEVRRARVSSDGVVDHDHVGMLLDHQTRLVSIMLGNNETGVLQPVREIAQMCAGRSVPLHTDAVQVVGKLPVNFRELGVATMSLAAHKFHGPKGIGALIIRQNTSLQPILFGGFQEAGLRPGTQCVALTVGMRKALELWECEREQRSQRMARLRDRLERQIVAGSPEVVILGAAASRLPHTSNLSFPGLNRQAILMALDLVGVACSTGSACASGSSDPSPVLIAMGCSQAVVEGSIRISLGALTTVEDVDEAVRRILRVIRALRQKKSPEKSVNPPPQEGEKRVKSSLS